MRSTLENLSEEKKEILLQFIDAAENEIFSYDQLGPVCGQYAMDLRQVNRKEMTKTARHIDVIS